MCAGSEARSSSPPRPNPGRRLLGRWDRLPAQLPHEVIGVNPAPLRRMVVPVGSASGTQRAHEGGIAHEGEIKRDNLIVVAQLLAAVQASSIPIKMPWSITRHGV